MSGYYPQIFFETAWAATIVPFASQTTLYALKAFGGYDLRVPFVIAVCGATFGQMLNWGLGKYFLTLRGRQKIPLSNERYDKISRLFNRYGIFLLFFSWVPPMNFLVIAAGFLNSRPRYILPLIIAGQIVNYGRIFY